MAQRAEILITTLRQASTAFSAVLYMDPVILLLIKPMDYLMYIELTQATLYKIAFGSPQLIIDHGGSAPILESLGGIGMTIK